MTVLAIAYLVCMAIQLLPGSAFQNKPQLKWDGPHVYLAIAQTCFGVALAILLVT